VTITKRVDRDLVLEWANAAAWVADDKQGFDTTVLEVGAVMGITDFFVITSGSNSRQVRTIAEEVEKRLKDLGIGSPRVEGRSNLTWVLLDYGDLVVHVFLEETRRFYDIERLYRDVPVIDWRAAAS
jgi:ribosome-associated protein